ncbi:eukaryotic translation initiation factor 5B [Cinnamomum micranthum f. kanehirae]|uniref:Eukaryotic translation initiation factor 5B n=1 Tax=Cinnamomum micranthum f. kanehirae TaxID=337451 RepID=A0A3S3NDM9_9MAGN|nr:eukaryotic translation initiation factor 5B [Cinnamomum micranthum f. kanehirae]
MEEAKDMETEIKCAMRARVKDFNDQADSLTLEGVRRMLEKDMGLETFALDAHKRFIKQCLQECFESIDEANGSKNTSENSQQTVQSVKEDTNPCEEPQMQKEAPGDEENGEESRDSVKKEISEHETEETQGPVSKSVPSKETIKNAIKKRASYFRANSATITLSGVRRLLEEDLKLEKKALDIHKSFINEQVDKVLEDADVESKKEVKKKCVKKAAIRGSKVSAKVKKGDGSEDSLDSIASISGDEEEIQPKRQTSQKGKAKKTEASKKRKRPSDEIESASSNGKNKPVVSITEKSSDADEGGNASEDNNSQSSAEENENVKKKSETSTTSYGKRVERLKSIIKSCGMSVPPSVYRKAKQAPESKREAYLIKEMEEILRREGLSTNPSEKEIKDVKRKKERAKELEGIDMSNIVSSTRRRSTSNFIVPPKPKVPVESSDDEEEDSDDDDDDDGSDSEDGSDGLNDDADDGSD